VVKVSVMYPNQPDVNFDFRYYLTVHIPLVKNLLGHNLRDVVVERGVQSANDGRGSAFVALGHLVFDSYNEFVEAFQPQATHIFADIPNYSNVQPVIQISEAVDLEGSGDA
jgi:uncharacterized protein (TIGR02118 family)